MDSDPSNDASLPPPGNSSHADKPPPPDSKKPPTTGTPPEEGAIPPSEAPTNTSIPSSVYYPRRERRPSSFPSSVPSSNPTCDYVEDSEGFNSRKMNGVTRKNPSSLPSGVPTSDQSHEINQMTLTARSEPSSLPSQEPSAVPTSYYIEKEVSTETEEGNNTSISLSSVNPTPSPWNETHENNEDVPTSSPSFLPSNQPYSIPRSENNLLSSAPSTIIPSVVDSGRPYSLSPSTTRKDIVFEFGTGSPSVQLPVGESENKLVTEAPSHAPTERAFDRNAAENEDAKVSAAVQVTTAAIFCLAALLAVCFYWKQSYNRKSTSLFRKSYGRFPVDEGGWDVPLSSYSTTSKQFSEDINAEEYFSDDISDSPKRNAVSYSGTTKYPSSASPSKYEKISREDKQHHYV